MTLVGGMPSPDPCAQLLTPHPIVSGLGLLSFTSRPLASCFTKLSSCPCSCPPPICLREEGESLSFLLRHSPDYVARHLSPSRPSTSSLVAPTTPLQISRTITPSTDDMTGPSRGTPRPLRNDTYVPVSSNSSVSPSPERAPAHRPQHQALEHHLRNIVDVEEPSRLMECSQLQRQRQFQYLVRRLVLSSKTCPNRFIDGGVVIFPKYSMAVRMRIARLQPVSVARSASTSGHSAHPLSSRHAHLLIFLRAKTTRTMACVPTR